LGSLCDPELIVNDTISIFDALERFEMTHFWTNANHSVATASCIWSLLWLLRQPTDHTGPFIYLERWGNPIIFWDWQPPRVMRCRDTLTCFHGILTHSWSEINAIRIMKFSLDFCGLSATEQEKWDENMFIIWPTTCQR
jgi:hypothetical protein